MKITYTTKWEHLKHEAWEAFAENERGDCGYSNIYPKSKYTIMEVSKVFPEEARKAFEKAEKPKIKRPACKLDELLGKEKVSALMKEANKMVFMGTPMSFYDEASLLAIIGWMSDYRNSLWLVDKKSTKNPKTIELMKEILKMELDLEE